MTNKLMTVERKITRKNFWSYKNKWWLLED